MTEIRGRVAFVTGGGSGIGNAIAQELASQGAAVAVADILLTSAETAAAAIREGGGAAIALHCDVTDRNSIAAAKQMAVSMLGPVSLMVANAGATSFERFDEMDVADIDWIIHANLMGVVNCALAFYPDMAAAGDGHLFATSSTAGLMPGWVPYHAPYSAAKLGAIGFMLNLAVEAAERNVGVTVLAPGGVLTGMQKNNARYRPERFGGPGEGEIVPPQGFAHQGGKLHFRPAEEVGRMVVEAIRANRRLIVSDASLRGVFRETYVALVEEAFDFVEAFDRRNEDRA